MKSSRQLQPLTIAQIRDLTSAELSAVFSADSTPSSGKLYRLSMPAAKNFCTATPVRLRRHQWMVTSVAGKTLQLAFFSGSSMPVLKPEA